MANFCYEDDRGFLTEEVKRMVVKLNDALTPWAVLVGKIATHKRLTEIASWYRSGDPTDGVTVYARVNLRAPGDLYVGETKRWEQRVKQHYVATCKHRIGAPKACGRCIEHSKYKKHRAAQPHQWIMIPIMTVSAKHEAKRMERKLIQLLTPHINASDKPFWALKQTYASNLLSSRRSKKASKKPWSMIKPKHGPRAKPPARTTTYELYGNVYIDFGAVLHIMCESDMAEWVTIHPGQYDFTRWSRVRRLYGESTLRCPSDEPSFCGALKDWKTTHVCTTRVLVTPAKAEIASRKELSAVFDEINDFAKQLCDASEEDMAFYWRVRNTVDKQRRYKVRKMVWDECLRRYGCPKVPITVRIPFFYQLDGGKVTSLLRRKIDTQSWPNYLKAWHKCHVKLVTESQPSISEILCNVNRPWLKCEGCCCQEVKKRLRQRGYKGTLPEIDSHLFFISRDYDGPNKEALSIGANNVPKQTRWDMQRAWESVNKQLPDWLREDKTSWARELKQCLTHADGYNDQFPKTKAVYTLRKDLSGLVIGETDKNLHELWFCCPMLYKRAWSKLYNDDTGYAKIYPRKASSAARTQHNIFETSPLPVRSRGHESDIVKVWERTYKAKQWNKIAPFNKKGGFNRPYILFKSKNITDHSTRREKWAKARPIAPQTKHPMRSLFHLSGKAWSFITANLTGDHFVIQHGGRVTDFLHQAEEKLASKGELRAVIKDIEGCFPNMNKDAIRLGLRSITQRLTTEYGHRAVFVPKRGNKPCVWKTKAQGYVEISFDTLIDIMEFALENTLIKDFDGQLWKQIKGIPMGDPHSPGMTIGACSWMEHEWMQTLDPATKEFFIARRYMDDILLFYAESATFDSKSFLADFCKSECYLPPLKLEDAKSDTFLETRFEIAPTNKVRHWLKNDNVPGQPKAVWRYAHFHSHTTFAQKRGVLMACLKKVHAMASDKRALRQSAQDKLHEFFTLQYPAKMLWGACTTMGTHTRDPAWFDVRDGIDANYAAA